MEDQPLKWWQVRWGSAGRAIAQFAIVLGKIVSTSALIAVVVLCPIYLIWPWLVARHFRKDPRLDLIPVTLQNQGFAPLSSAKIECPGLTLRLPMEEVVRLATVGPETMVQLRRGGWLRIQDAARDELLFSGSMNKPLMETIPGAPSLRSKFALMDAAMSATPEQVKWWRFRSAENERIDDLLTLKFFAELAPFSLRPSQAPIYRLAFGGLRGFQLGSPGLAPYDVQLDLFDETDRHYTLDLMGADVHGPLLTQEQINAIAASIRPVSTR